MVLSDPYHCISRLSAGGCEVMFNTAMQGGDIAMNARIVEVVAFVDVGFGTLLDSVE